MGDVGRTNVTREFARDNLTNLLVTLPTGYGKTRVAHRAMDLFGGVSIIIPPLKVLANQIVDEVQRIGYRPIKITSDTNKDNRVRNRFRDHDYDCIVATPEKLDLALRKKVLRDAWGFGRNVNLVVVDEIHLIHDKSRGSRLESAIKKLMWWYPQVTIVGLSATIGNYADFAQWMSARSVYAPASERPCPLDVRISTYGDVYGNRQKNDAIRRLLVKEVKQLSRGDQWISFYGSRSRTKDEQAQLQSQLPDLDIRFLHAGLGASDKDAVVADFVAGMVDGLVATTVVAQGFDSDCSAIFVANPTRYDFLSSSETLIEPHELKQMIGRVRRPLAGKRVGLAVAMCNNFISDAVLEGMTQPSDIRSNIPEYLDEKLVEWAVSGIREIDGLMWMATTSFNRVVRVETVSEVIAWLIKMQFLQVTGDKVVPTLWAYAMAGNMIQPETVIHLRNCVKNISQVDDPPEPRRLFAMFIDTPEFIDNVAVRYDNKSDARVLELGRLYIGFHADNRIVKAFAMKCADYIIAREVAKQNAFLNLVRDSAGVRYASFDAVPEHILHSYFNAAVDAGIYTDGEHRKACDPRYDLKIGRSSTDKRTLRDMCDRAFRAAADIAAITKARHTHVIGDVLAMLEAGVYDESAYKVRMLDGVGEKRFNNLVKAGILTVEQILATDPDTLKIAMGARAGKSAVNAALASAMRSVG